MKKTHIIAMLLVLCLILLAGCSNTGTVASTPEPTESAAAVQPTAEPADTTVYKVIFAHHQTTESPIGAGIERLAATLNEKSGGRLEVQTYPAEQLGNESAVFEQMTQGTVQMSTFGFGIIGSMSPSALAMEMGYMFEDYNHLQNFLASDVFQQIVSDAVNVCGVHVISAYYNGTRHMTTTDTPVTKPEDLEGVKIRVPNSEMILKTIQAMGANATVMAFSETYMGLQNGTVDGQENPVPSIVSMKFQEVQGYLCKTGHMIQAATICINDEFLSSLPQDLQDLIIEETKAELLNVSEEVQQKEVDQEKILTDAGMKILEVDKEAFKDRMSDLIAEYELVWGEGLFDKIQSTK